MLKSLNAIDASARGLDQGVRRMGVVARVLRTPDVVLRAAAKDVQPMIRSMLRGNLSRAGVRTRTGTLARAVASVVVGINLSKARLVYAYPSGIKGYPGQPNFYKAAGSVNYGAVHQPQATRPTFDTVTGKVNRFEKRGALGSRAKKTIKQIALGVKASGGTQTFRQNRLGQSRTVTIGAGRKNDTSKSVSIGAGIVVIKPHRFFTLSKAQRAAVRKYFVKRAAQRLAEAARNG